MPGPPKLSRRAILAGCGTLYPGRGLAAPGRMIEGKEIVVAPGAVATEPADAARTGALILEAGGNAMDAVAAACLASGAIQPETGPTPAGNVLCAVVLGGSSDRIWSLDSNSTAPAAAHEPLFEGR